MRWFIVFVLLCIIGVGAIFYLRTQGVFFFFAPLTEEPISAEDETATDEAVVEEGDPADEVPEAVSAITAAEDWSFPDPDVVLQGEWYHVNKECERLRPDPPPTPMLRQIALATGFKPCFICSRDDASRPADEGAGVPEAFLRPPDEAAPALAEP